MICDVVDLVILVENHSWRYFNSARMRNCSYVAAT